MSASLLVDSHRLLLRAGFLDPAAALCEWEHWQRLNDLDAIDPHAFQVLPLVYLNLSGLDANVPHGAKLRGIYKRTWLSNQHALRRLAVVLHRLEAINVSVLLHRSIALVWQHYCKRGALPLRDIDLAVRLEDVAAVDAALRQSGCRPQKSLPPERLRLLFHGLSYRHQHETNVRLSWRPLTLDRSPDIDRALWRRSRRASVGGAAPLVPSVGDLLLMTCVQGREAPSSSRLGRLAEAAVLLRAAGPSVNWPAVRERAVQLDRLEQVAAMLGYLARELDLPRPEDLSEGVSGPAPARPSRVEAPGPLRAALARIWSDYRLACRFGGYESRSLGLLRFGLAYYQYCWNLRRAFWVPFVAIFKIGSRLSQGRARS